jgi:hypothetical protein
MIGFALDKFIDEMAKVEAAEHKATIRALQKAAYKIFRDAQTSIEVSPEYAAVGAPPHSRRGQLKHAIRYNVDKAAGIAVIGPTQSEMGDVAAAHEFGEIYYGKHYPKRPFMGPALERNKDSLPIFWSGEIHE